MNIETIVYLNTENNNKKYIYFLEHKFPIEQKVSKAKVIFLYLFSIFLNYIRLKQYECLK